MDRLIITGANGSGKSFLADRLHILRPEIPTYSFDAMKLRTDWQKRPRDDVETSLKTCLQGACWIIEGGPSLLPLAISRSDFVVWLDPPFAMRAWRLLKRPWLNFGKTRPELPAGNVDYPMQQYQFAWESLKKQRSFDAAIDLHLASIPKHQKMRCRTRADVAAFEKIWCR